MTIADSWRRPRCSASYKNAQSSISNPPSPLAAAGPVHPSISQVQTESDDGALKSIGPSSSAEGKERTGTDHGHNEDGHKRVEDRTATAAIAIRDASKRTADDTDLNKGGKGVPGSGKVRRKGQSVGPSRSIPCLMVPERPYQRYR